jgi:hypothetical protein
VELDTDLLNRNLFRKVAFLHLVLETPNINFQQIDTIVLIDPHLAREAGARNGHSPPGLQPCARIFSALVRFISVSVYNELPVA